MQYESSSLLEIHCTQDKWNWDSFHCPQKQKHGEAEQVWGRADPMETQSVCGVPVNMYKAILFSGRLSSCYSCWVNPWAPDQKMSLMLRGTQPEQYWICKWTDTISITSSVLKSRAYEIHLSLLEETSSSSCSATQLNWIHMALSDKLRYTSSFWLYTLLLHTKITHWLLLPSTPRQHPKNPYQSQSAGQGIAHGAS